jgi:hypothetical protein
MWPLGALQPPILALVLVAIVGSAVFGGVLYLFDLGGLVRSTTARLLTPRKRRQAAGAEGLCPGGPP